MMGIGATEIVLILVITLIVVGPEKMPELARSLARLVRDIRRVMDDAREQIDEITREELLNKKDVDSYYKDVVDSVKKSIEPPAELKNIGKDIKESVKQLDRQIEKQLEEPAQPVEQKQAEAPGQPDEPRESEEPEKEQNPPAQPSP